MSSGASIAPFILIAMFAAMPLMARPISDGERALLPLFAQVLRESGAGMTQREAAAFVTGGEGEPAGCVMWPPSPAVKRQTYRGPIPRATRAIVHTHPVRMQRPSTHDVEQARLSGMPFYVVTRGAVWRADPDGSVTELVRDERWWKSVERVGCHSIPSYLAELSLRGGGHPWQEARLATVSAP